MNRRHRVEYETLPTSEFTALYTHPRVIVVSVERAVSQVHGGTMGWHVTAMYESEGRLIEETFTARTKAAIAFELERPVPGGLARVGSRVAGWGKNPVERTITAVA